MQYKGHPIADKYGRVLLHWLTMYNADPELTRYAKQHKWTIHHKNGKRDDNRLDNLEWRLPGMHAQGVSIDEMITSLEYLGYTVTKND